MNCVKQQDNELFFKLSINNFDLSSSVCVVGLFA